jgi:hypothetical protein
MRKMMAHTAGQTPSCSFDLYGGSGQSPVLRTMRRSPFQSTMRTRLTRHRLAAQTNI